MMPLDDTPRNDDHVSTTATPDPPADESAPALDGIWSSIGPGRVPDHGEGPPTIRPTDLAATVPTGIGYQSRQDRILPAEPEKDLLVTEQTPPTDSDSAADALRDELRIGVRMLQALESQFTRAESLIRREEDAAARAEDAIDRLGRRLDSIDTATAVATDVDAGAVGRAVDEALTRIDTAADDVARRLHDRLARFVDLDTRLDELDATLQTVERRITRIDENANNDPTPTTGITPTASSGSLSVEPRAEASLPTPHGSDPSSETVAALARLQLLIDRGDEVRQELRRDLEAICTASATLVEVVEQAATTERTLRGTLDQATPGTDAHRDEHAPEGWTVASILRRLADEFDAGINTTPPSDAPTPPTRPMPTGLASIRPIELDVTPGDGMPTPREPLEATLDGESHPV